ncbi:UNVERIFIED_CONTAM: hypothetical protein PYX00_005330 [Menopon gallinae]|uniref:AIMP2 thioredoxin-like domain-containing protein n=1 Tax=Menopon gallinae TaxID=328185 RepID=A0AAW2HSF5_9NEOP
MDNTNVMYKMRPIFQLPEKIDLPTCMYSMRKILNSKIENYSTSDNNEILNHIVDKKPLPELPELEARWDKILDQLHQLTSEVNELKEQISSINVSDDPSLLLNLPKVHFDNLKGAVINADPSRPPYSLLFINRFYKIFSIKTHVHSSVKSIPDSAKDFGQSESDKGLINITLIWKGGLLDTELILSPVKHISILGEVNILRYLGRLGLGFLQYPDTSGDATNNADGILDLCHHLQHTEVTREISTLYKNLASGLQRKEYFGNNIFNICDIAVWSVVKQKGCQNLTQNLVKWFNVMEQHMKY